MRIYTGAVRNSGRKFALKCDCGRRTPCHTRESNLRWYYAQLFGWTLYQLSCPVSATEVYQVNYPSPTVNSYLPAEITLPTIELYQMNYELCIPDSELYLPTEITLPTIGLYQMNYHPLQWTLSTNWDNPPYHWALPNELSSPTVNSIYELR